MVVLPTHGVGFVHIPKTGGEWVAKVLAHVDPAAHNVAPPGYYHKHALPPLRGNPLRPRFLFAVVREPCAWVESWWRYQSGSGWCDWDPNYWHPFRALQACRAAEFNDSVRLLLQREPGFVTRLYEWYCGPDNLHVDAVGDTAHLARDVGAILERAGVAVDPATLQLPRVNVARSPRPTWDPELRARFLATEACARRWAVS